MAGYAIMRDIEQAREKGKIQRCRMLHREERSGTRAGGWRRERGSAREGRDGLYELYERGRGSLAKAWVFRPRPREPWTPGRMVQAWKRPYRLETDRREEVLAGAGKSRLVELEGARIGYMGIGMVFPDVRCSERLGQAEPVPVVHLR